MDPEIKRVGAIALVIILVTVGMLFLFDQRFDEERVVSQIDGLDYIIDDFDETSTNITFRFDVTIENYGEIKDKEISCSSIQSYLKVKNSSVPVEIDYTTFEENRSYILDTTYTQDSCDDKPTKFRISENIIDEIIVAVPFHMINGSYAFIWYHSFADEFDAVVIDIDISQGNIVIDYQLEADIENE